MTPEFKAQCADKITGCRYIRFTEQDHVICVLNTVNGSTLVGNSATEVGAHQSALRQLYDREAYLLKEREYENGLGILGVRFKSDPPYEVQPDTPES